MFTPAILSTVAFLTTTLLLLPSLHASVPHQQANLGSAPRLRLPSSNLALVHPERIEQAEEFEGRDSTEMDDGEGSLPGTASDCKNQSLGSYRGRRRRQRCSGGLSSRPYSSFGSGFAGLRGGGVAKSDQDSDGEDESEDFDDLIASDVSDSELDVAFSGEVSGGEWRSSKQPKPRMLTQQTHRQHNNRGCKTGLSRLT